jgi:RNA polymerase-binding transcription factor DksA
MRLELTAAELREERGRLAAERRRLDDALGEEAGAAAERCTLQDSIAQVLDEIDDALGRIDAGTYGLCARCGQPISAPRLAALPYAVRCVDCAALGTGEHTR